MAVLEATGIILDSTRQPLSRRVAFFTSLCPLHDGTILCAAQQGAAKHAPTSSLWLGRSTDGGQTWTALPWNWTTRLGDIPGSLSGAELVESEPGRLLLFATWFNRQDPDRPLFDPQTEGLLRSRQLLAESRDGGASWSDWRQVPTGTLRGTALTGPVLHWPSGLLAFPFESFKEYDDTSPKQHGSWVIISRDGGTAFSEPLLVAQDPDHRIYYWDQRLCATGDDGEFLAMFWTHDLTIKKDLDVHQCWGRITGSRIVTSECQSARIPGQIAAPVQLANGRLAALVVSREHPGTITLWCSHDRGRTWPDDQKLVIYRHDQRHNRNLGVVEVEYGEYWNEMLQWSFGHPALRSLDADHLLLAWYAGTPDALSLHWARVRV
jgi:hypothetical protein